MCMTAPSHLTTVFCCSCWSLLTTTNSINRTGGANTNMKPYRPFPYFPSLVHLQHWNSRARVVAPFESNQHVWMNKWCWSELELWAAAQVNELVWELDQVLALAWGVGVGGCTLKTSAQTLLACGGVRRRKMMPVEVCYLCLMLLHPWLCLHTGWFPYVCVWCLTLICVFSTVCVWSNHKCVHSQPLAPLTYYHSVLPSSVLLNSIKASPPGVCIVNQAWQ